MAETTPEMVERATQAAMAELRRQADEPGSFAPCVMDDQDLVDVLVDGRINLRAVVRAAIEAMREPTPKMLRAGFVHIRPEKVWHAMMDAALSE